MRLVRGMSSVGIWWGAVEGPGVGLLAAARLWAPMWRPAPLLAVVEGASGREAPGDLVALPWPGVVATFGVGPLSTASMWRGVPCERLQPGWRSTCGGCASSGRLNGSDVWGCLRGRSWSCLVTVLPVVLGPLQSVWWPPGFPLVLVVATLASPSVFPLVEDDEWALRRRGSCCCGSPGYVAGQRCHFGWRHGVGKLYRDVFSWGALREGTWAACHRELSECCW